MIADLDSTFSERLPVRRALAAAGVSLLICPARSPAQPLMFTMRDLGDLGEIACTSPFPVTFATGTTSNRDFLVAASFVSPSFQTCLDVHPQICGAQRSCLLDLAFSSVESSCRVPRVEFSGVERKNKVRTNAA